MKAAIITKIGTLEIGDIPEPEITDYQVLTKTLTCGICTGTDRKLIEGHFKGFTTYPAVLGHEAVGEVVKSGKKVRYYKKGDRVLRPGLFKIGDGKSMFSGWGGFSEYTVAADYHAMLEDGFKDNNVFFMSQQVIPEDIDSESAVMLITFKEVLSAFYRFGLSSNKTVAIFGAGPVGLTFIRFARIMGLREISAIDSHDKRLDLARQFGADHCINFKKDSTKEALKEICPDGFDFIIDAAGSPKIIQDALELIRFNGKICIYGIPPYSNMNLEWGKAPYNWDIHFLQWPTFEEESSTHHQICSMVKTRVLNPTQYISRVLPFEKINEGFRILKEADAIKVIIRF